jgi:hypothetical protein
LKIYYRISDKSYEKTKLPGADKETCLMNFISCFADVVFPEGPVSQNSNMRIIADRCNRTTNKMLMGTGIPVTISDKGNAGSFELALAMALEECQGNEIVYFVEDDYLHKSTDCSKLIEQGLKHADYVTLYDHPDKYTKFYDGGETSKVFKTSLSHWRYTISTCLTFATTVGTLKEDLEIWEDKMGWVERSLMGAPDHPNDHRLFSFLNAKGRLLAVCIPGFACHTDLTFSGGVNSVLIEPWAIEMMTDKMLDKIQCNILNDENREDLRALISVAKLKHGWEKLVALDVLYQAYK